MPHVAMIISRAQNISCGLLVDIDVGLRKVLLSMAFIGTPCEYLVLALDLEGFCAVCHLGVIREDLSHCIIITHRFFHIYSPLPSCHINPKIGFTYHTTLGYTIAPLSLWYSERGYWKNDPQ